MIPLNKVKEQIRELFKKRFPKVDFVIHERRSIILEMRVIFNSKVFMDLYINTLTGKQSYTVIENGKRVWGYDNYRFWHQHPVEDPEKHISCSEPSFEKIQPVQLLFLDRITGLTRYFFILSIIYNNSLTLSLISPLFFPNLSIKPISFRL